MTTESLLEPIARAICKAWLLKERESLMASGEAAKAVVLTLATFSGVENCWRDFLPEAREVLTAIEGAGFRPEPPATFETQTLALSRDYPPRHE